VAREVHENVVEGWSSQADVNDLNVLCGEFNHHRAESLHTFGDRNRNERLLIVDADGPYCEWSNERLNARKVLGEREVDIEMLPPRYGVSILVTCPARLRDRGQSPRFRGQVDRLPQGIAL